MNEKEIMKLMNNINYGWMDKKGIKHINDFETFSDEYILQSPEEIIKNQVGVCWDQVELERYYFNNNSSVKTFFIVHYDNDKCPSHTFLTFVKNNMYYWFEHSWEKYRGIHEYSSLKDLLFDVRNKFIKTELNGEYVDNNLVIHEYNKPKYYISVLEFYKHCDDGKFIDLNNI